MMFTNDVASFIDSLSKLSKEFPLWSSVGFSIRVSHSTSSHVEGYLNDVKTRVFVVLPVRADKFVKYHIVDIQRATPLFASKIIAFLNTQSAEDRNEPNLNTQVVSSVQNNIVIDAPMKTKAVCTGEPRTVDSINACK